jgi:hypothetical protein
VSLPATGGHGLVHDDVGAEGDALFATHRRQGLQGRCNGNIDILKHQKEGKIILSISPPYFCCIL